VTRWPGSNGDQAGRWPGRLRQATPVEPPSWFRCFTLDDWTRPGDDEVRYEAGGLMGAEEVARRRHLDACRQWAKDCPGFSVVDWLRERREARLREQGLDP
jgi:hypothetical protein